MFRHLRQTSTSAAWLASSLALVLGCSTGVSDDDSWGPMSTDASTDDGDGDGDGDGDTGPSSVCGDEICDSVTESCQSCPEDCGVCPYCGDGMCNGGEDCMLCALDCEVCPTCGDGVCSGDEDCSNCEQDCGMCAPACGDGVCNGGENCFNCEQDCGPCPCPNNSCDDDESCASCPEDCGPCPCPCNDDPNFNGFCQYAPGTEGCVMTQPGGYCDPNGDGSYEDGDWDMGVADYAAQCD